MMNDKNPRGAGRKPANPQLKKNPLHIKLEQYLIDWLRSQDDSQSVLIAEALNKAYDIKKHKPELHKAVEKGCEPQDDSGKYFYRCVHGVKVYAGDNSKEVMAFLIEKGIVTKDYY